MNASHTFTVYRPTRMPNALGINLARLTSPQPTVQLIKVRPATARVNNSLERRLSRLSRIRKDVASNILNRFRDSEPLKCQVLTRVALSLSFSLYMISIVLFSTILGLNRVYFNLYRALFSFNHSFTYSKSTTPFENSTTEHAAVHHLLVPVP